MSCAPPLRLTDLERSIIEPLLPKGPRGAPRFDDHRKPDGIQWRLHMGSP